MPEPDDMQDAATPPDPDARAADGAATQGSRVVGLWVELSAIMWMPRQGESVVERLATPPWESADPLILALWDKITAPAHELELAVLAAQDNINPTAREYFLAALEACRRRRMALQEAADRSAGDPADPTDLFAELDRPLDDEPS